MKPLKPSQAPRTKFLVKELLYVPRTVYRILPKTLSPIKGHDSNDEEVVGIMKNLLFNIMHGIPVNYHASWGLWQMLHSLHLSWSLTLLGLWDSSEQGLHSTTRLIFRIISATCPPLKSSNGHFPQLMKRARPLQLLMKAFIHWMVSYAKLHLIPPMMTLPLMILLPMHPSQILKPQL